MSLVASITAALQRVATEFKSLAAVARSGSWADLTNKPATLAKMTFAGALTPTVGTAKFCPDRGITLTKVYFTLGTTDSVSVTIDVLKNGVSILDGTNPTCAAGDTKSTSVALNVAVNGTTDYLTVSILTASSGADLVAHIAYQ